MNINTKQKSAMKLMIQLREQLESIGATLDEQAEQFVVCDSPSGYVWRANGGTSLTIRYRNNGGQSWLAQALRDGMPNLKMGLNKVTDPDELVEHRHGLNDDSWGAPAEASNGQRARTEYAGTAETTQLQPVCCAYLSG